MTRKECLDAAAGCVLKDRNASYGGPEDSFGMIARMWGAYLGVCVSAHDVAALMALLKIARFRHNPLHEDNAVDCAGYAACMVECATAWEREGEGEAEGCEEPEFKEGDKVQACYNEERGVWFDGVVEKVKEGYCHIRRPNGEEISAPKKLIRRQPAEIEPPKFTPFSPGDKVQFRVTLPSVSDRIWVDGTYARYDRGCAFPHAVYNDVGREENVKEEDIRPAPKAEGYEDLVFDEDRMRESMPGIVPQDGPSDFDAPQTKEELMERIRSANPAIYHGGGD